MVGTHVPTRIRAVASLACGVVVACSGGPPAATVDGGSHGIALLGDHVVAASPGDTVTITHDGAPPAEDHDAPVTHAFVGGAGDSLPPLFVPGQGGLVPNGAVYGPCAGGTVDRAVGTCPIPPVEGPKRWDGVAYLSLGAMLPGEQRELPLAEEMQVDEAVLVCALHPELRVVLRDGANAAAPTPGAGATEAAVAAANAVAGTQDGEAVVVAGVTGDDAYVGRFVPQKVTITAGESVTWRAGGRAPVDVVFNGGDLDLTHTNPSDGMAAGKAKGWNGRGELRSGYLSDDERAGAGGQEWTVTFLRPGRYAYASRFGAEFTGVVVVESS